MLLYGRMVCKTPLLVLDQRLRLFPLLPVPALLVSRFQEGVSHVVDFNRGWLVLSRSET